MQPSNQNNAEPSTSYDCDTALEFFKLFGTFESARRGEIIFTQGQKSNRFLLQQDKIYLLVRGKVMIDVASENVASVNPGEIFGELTPLILSVRSATAIADVPCKLMTLSERQLIAGLKKKPEFALMLMGVLVGYLRKSVTGAKGRSFSESKNIKKKQAFNAKTLRELMQKLGDESVITMPKQRIIFQEGGTGVLMYVILDGYVTASIGDRVVERSGPGDVIGEIALIDQKRRVAKVVAETNCSLLAFNRQVFLDLVKTHPVFSMSLLRVLASRLYLCRTGSSPASPLSFFDGF
jgi:CRP-like cAMP-binding protein